MSITLTEHEQLKITILESRGASFWLKKAIAELEQRDIVDAVEDLKTLLWVFEGCDE